MRSWPRSVDGCHVKPAAWPPAIPPTAGWNLINEPRCYKCGTVLEGWVKEMAAYVKALDPNHLLTVSLTECRQEGSARERPSSWSG